MGQRALPLLLAALAACGDAAAPPETPSAPAVASDSPAGLASPTPAPSSDPSADRAPAAPAPLLARFPDRAAARGLAYVNRSGRPDKPTILEANGAGVALLDLEADGDLDAVFGQGLASPDALLAGPGADLEVFRNDGAARFQRAPGPGLSGWWTGLAVGDVDGDGDADLVAGAFGDLVLLRQKPGGSLAPVAEAGLMPSPEDAPAARLVPGEPRAAGLPPLWATSVALFDADRDGVLDLYVGQYLDLDPVDPPIGELGEGALAFPCTWKGMTVYCGPRGMDAQPDRVLRGLGDGRFEDASARWLPDHRPAFTLGLAPFDADADGDTDVYVANDSTPNLMLINDGSGRLEDRAEGAGVAVNQDGAPEAGMGVAVGDVNRDGLVDLVVTNFSEEPTQLYFGAARGFSVETYRRGLSHQTQRLLSWGVHFLDADGDGWLELFTGNGHVYPQADEPGTGTSYGQPDRLWRLGPFPAGNQGWRVTPFEPATPDDLLAAAAGTRGSAVGDLDGDGDPDLVCVRIDGPAALGLNAMAPDASWLVVQCVGAGAADRGAMDSGAAVGPGPRSPRDGIGAHVTLFPADPAGALPVQTAEVQTAVGYQSASSPWPGFGLGRAESHGGLEIRWPSGRVERVAPGPANRHLVVEEGRGVVRDTPLRAAEDDG